MSGDKATIRIMGEAFCGAEHCINMARIPTPSCSFLGIVYELRAMGWTVTGSRRKGYVVRCSNHSW